MTQKKNKVTKFLTESYDELKKTSWPSKAELKQQTGIVVIVVIAVAIMIGIADLVIERIIILFLS